MRELHQSIDVTAIQAKLSELGLYRGQVDGVAGALTRDAIRAYQAKHGLRIDGIAGPVTLGSLFPKLAAAIEAAVPKIETGILTAARLRRMWPNAKPAIVAGIASSAGTVLPLHGLTTANRLIHFMAQVSHECGGGTLYEENLSYRAARIGQVFPKYFRGVSTAAYAHNPRALGNRVYGGRMGNRPGTSDGYDYRGRGIIQITGRDGYAEVAKISGLDLVDHPELATEPQNLLAIAAAFWTWKNLNAVVDGTRTVKGYARGSIEAVTKIVNGGQNGIADRRAWFKRWERELT